ncbi:hypothetical protein FRC15_009889 [Serendipita sp. 397]|nr:hypothetical protein FRC15_009889 [Serendipita sp. 397]
MGRLSARAISYLLLTYVLVSCLYVLFILLAFPLARAVLSRQPAISVHSIPENWRNDQIFWRYNTDSILTSSTGRQYAISESLFLGKAFDHSMRPSKVVPFYFKAVGTKSNGEFQREDITILTIVTSNRFSVLAKLVKRYQGKVNFISPLPLKLK